MIIRAIDSSNDWQFGKGTESYNFGVAAISENIKTRLLSFLGNCFFDAAAGIDWFTYFGVPNKSNEIVLRARAVILQSYGVLSVNSISLNASNISRKATLTYSINTLYSQNNVQTVEVLQYV